MTAITRDNVESLVDRRQIQVAMRNGNWWDIRPNGAVRRWKRDTARIAVPYKAGLKVYGTITEHDFLPDGTLRPDYYRLKPGAVYLGGYSRLLTGPDRRLSSRGEQCETQENYAVFLRFSLAAICTHGAYSTLHLWRSRQRDNESNRERANLLQ